MAASGKLRGKAPCKQAEIRPENVVSAARRNLYRLPASQN
jgi:hypothetical protein